jgi:uncharacterized protein YfaS (alpha-2-macroglobulin family)
MAVELGARKLGKSTDFSVDLSIPVPYQLAGSQHNANSETIAFDASSTIKPEQDLSLELNKSKGEIKEIKIHKKGTGRLYYSTVLSYHQVLKAGQNVAAHGIPAGLHIKREFFKLVPSAPDSNGNVHFTAQPLFDHKVKAGETILMKVYVDSPIVCPYVCLQAPLPSGAEVVENDSRGDAKEAGSGTNEKQEDSYSWGNWWWTHQDVMDDHIAFFVTDFPNHKAELHQMIRMEIPGKFQINPVSMEGMYTKGIKAHSEADEITVTE